MAANARAVCQGLQVCYYGIELCVSVMSRNVIVMWVFVGDRWRGGNREN
ncbi:hypothetical protein LINGRAHAP2_LOCUS23833 [Linum grandiflorum]